MAQTQVQTMALSNLSDSSDLADIQNWLMLAITAPRGLSEGLTAMREAGNAQIAEVILASQGQDPHGGLNIYAQGYWLRLFSCLKADYSALQRLLGEPLFEFFAREYLSQHPSKSFSLYDLGDGFVPFLRRTQSASVKSADKGKLRFPLELAHIERAMAFSMRSLGLENCPLEVVDTLSLLFGENINVELPATTQLLMTHHPLSAFQSILYGQVTIEAVEVGSQYICIQRHQYRVSCEELLPWQFYFLLSAKGNRRTFLQCATAAARRTHNPIHGILAQLALWLPSAQMSGVLRLKVSL
jgi:hypothetical protein